MEQEREKKLWYKTLSGYFPISHHALAMPSFQSWNNRYHHFYQAIHKYWKETIFTSMFTLASSLSQVCVYWLLTEHQHFINQWNLWMLADLFQSLRWFLVQTLEFSVLLTVDTAHPLLHTHLHAHTYIHIHQLCAAKLLEQSIFCHVLNQSIRKKKGITFDSPWFCVWEFAAFLVLRPVIKKNLNWNVRDLLVVRKYKT